MYNIHNMYKNVVFDKKIKKKNKKHAYIVKLLFPQYDFVLCYAYQLNNNITV